MKLFSKLSLWGTLLIGAMSSLDAQDVRFSQYYSAPLRVNPAMIGMFEGRVRLGVNYRSQWGAVLNKAYKSFAATADTKIPVAKHDFIAAGFGAMTDFSGIGNYSTTEISLGAAYHKKLTKSRRGYNFNTFESSLIAGFQIGFGQRGIKWDNLTFSQQWDPDSGIYDTGVWSGEDGNVRQTRTYADINAGLMWTASMGKRKNMYVGLSAYHLNRPNISLFNLPIQVIGADTLVTTEKLYMRWVAHAGGEILLGARKSPLSLVPGAVVMFQGPSMELNAGVGIRYQAPSYDDFAFRLGVWTRVARQLETGFFPDAVMFIIGLDYRTLQVGLSYDLTVSTLKAATNGRGAMEMSVFYRFGYDGKRPQGCPTF